VRRYAWEAIEALLSRGAQVDAEARGADGGCTALIEAARLGMVDAMQRLVAGLLRVDPQLESSWLQRLSLPLDPS
jgi:hypothetical protein